MPEPLEGILEDQAISFSQRHRYSHWTQPHSHGRRTLQDQTTTWSLDLLNTTRCDEARTTSAGHNFDTKKARVVLERQ